MYPFVVKGLLALLHTAPQGAPTGGLLEKMCIPVFQVTDNEHKAPNYCSNYLFYPIYIMRHILL